MGNYCFARWRLSSVGGGGGEGAGGRVADTVQWASRVTFRYGDTLYLTWFEYTKIVTHFT